MATQDTEILEILKTNYQQAVALMPPDLAKEFQKKVIRTGDLKGYASSISVAIQFRDETSMQRIQNWMIDNFNKHGFGKKLADQGVDPIRIYEQLIKGIYDYR
jgi:hypothetical protein